MIDIDITQRMQTQEGVLDLSVRARIGDGELVTVGGRSGSGKTTFLRALAGLSRPDRGRITVNGVTWFDSKRKVNVRPQRRDVGFVFQDDALFPHLTVRENVLFARRDERAARDLLVFLELDHLASRFPRQLSGGQRQRVAVARALARGPRLLLLDEPFSHLDQALKVKLFAEVRRIHRRFGVTVILVTHDPAEISQLSQRHLVLAQGRLLAEPQPERGRVCQWSVPATGRAKTREGIICGN